MIETTRFSLETHEGEYANWPLRSCVYLDGIPSQTHVAGYQLLHQFETPLGYLLVTDCDCPYEEATSFCLLDISTLKIVSERTLSVPYGSYLLDEISWLEPHLARVRFCQDEHYLLRLMPPRGLFRPRAKIQLQRLAQSAIDSN